MAGTKANPVVSVLKILSQLELCDLYPRLRLGLSGGLSVSELLNLCGLSVGSAMGVILDLTRSFRRNQRNRENPDDVEEDEERESVNGFDWDLWDRK